MHISKSSSILLCVPFLLSVSTADAETGEIGSVNSPNGDWTNDAPGVEHYIDPADIPQATAFTPPQGSVASTATVIERPKDVLPKVPKGFGVEVFASGFTQPRTIRVAPNGDVFLSESGAGRVLVFRANAKGLQSKPEVFAEKLDRPYGIVFYPPTEPKYVYIAAANQVVRYPYGVIPATTPAEIIVDNIPTERHWTRDLAVSRDGKRLFLSVGSASNLGEEMEQLLLTDIQQFEESHGIGAAWGAEENRAVVRVFDPEGTEIRNFATGLRNCSGLAMQPETDNLWCVVNERDHLGPNLVPDFMTRVKDGGFYGWPWYYIGDHEDPALKGKRPDLKKVVLTPDVLIQAHSSALSLVFYDKKAFPESYRGDAFVALHGSHSRPERTGYKVIRVHMKDGEPTGAYEDFMTGFVVDNNTVWGRPAGVAVTNTGELLVSDDANGTIFKVTRK